MVEFGLKCSYDTVEPHEYVLRKINGTYVILDPRRGVSRPATEPYTRPMTALELEQLKQFVSEWVAY